MPDLAHAAYTVVESRPGYKLIESGYQPCVSCGKPHHCWREDGSKFYGSWADPEDGHAYRHTGPNQKVAGRCPMGCGEMLFLAAGGHVTCSWHACPDPGAADALLENGCPTG